MHLTSLESELIRHVQAEKRRWQDIATIVMRVEREQLWSAHAGSFSAWMGSVARRADVQESMIWRCLKAGRIYLELTGKAELDGAIAASAESLELAEKISRHAPRAVADDVLERTLEGALSRAELRHVWETYRSAAGGTTARGRLPGDAEARAQALEVRQAAWEAQKRKPENRAEVRRAELLSAFCEASWLGLFDQVRAEQRLRLESKLGALLVVRRKAQQPDRLELHGGWTIVAAPEFVDFEFTPPVGLDFVWLATSAELTPNALTHAPRMLGIVELRRDRALHVVREAQRRASRAESRVAVLSSLLQRAYVWP